MTSRRPGDLVCLDPACRGQNLELEKDAVQSNSGNGEGFRYAVHLHVTRYHTSHNHNAQLLKRSMIQDAMHIISDVHQYRLQRSFSIAGHMILLSEYLLPRATLHRFNRSSVYKCRSGLELVDCECDAAAEHRRPGASWSRPPSRHKHDAHGPLPPIAWHALFFPPPQDKTLMRVCALSQHVHVHGAPAADS